MKQAAKRHDEQCNKEIVVSIVIPVLNEERYIGECIDSLLKQTYPISNMECLVVDGMSKDNTIEIVKEYIKMYPGVIRLLENKKRTQACAINIGINKAVGKYLIRLDAHAAYATNYIEECVKALNTNNYDNVGGIALTKGKTEFGKTVACMMSSKFGVGNSDFRTIEESVETDTVPFGAFRKELFDRIGGFDERLNRNEDNEINYRIRKNGGRILLSNKIRFTYYCRDSLKEILNMAYQNGKWTLKASKYCPGSMRLRHFIPFVFVMSLIFGSVLSCFSFIVRILYLFELILYLALDIYFSLKSSNKFKQTLILLVLFPLFHISYGIGSLSGLVKIFRS